MIRRPPRSTHCISSAASDVYKRQDDDDIIVSRLVTDDLPEAVTLEKVVEETKKDSVLYQIWAAIQERRQCPEGPKFNTYRKIFDELVVEQGVVVRDQRIVLPRGLIRDCVELAHRGHPGPGATIALL